MRQPPRSTQGRSSAASDGYKRQMLTEFVPPGGPFVRVDTAAYQGSRVSPAYDSLIAKLIVWAPDREQAIARMARALDEFRIDGPGIATTAGFLAETVRSSAFPVSYTHLTLPTIYSV